MANKKLSDCQKRAGEVRKREIRKGNATNPTGIFWLFGGTLYLYGLTVSAKCH